MARMVHRTRYSFVQALTTSDGSWKDVEDVYVEGNFPTTAQRMQLYERFAPLLTQITLDKLALTEDERRSITHVVVTSCTGQYAPGLDFEIVRHLGLNPSIERTMINFMGCYAAINALKSAHHIIRSEPGAAVLMSNLELCTLHFQELHELEQVLSLLVFADGCSASLITAKPLGLAIDSFLALQIPDTSNLITWRVGERGFDMNLSGEVPGAIGRALKESESKLTRANPSPPSTGGPSIQEDAPFSIPSKRVSRSFPTHSTVRVKFLRDTAICPQQLSCSFWN